MKVSVTNAAKQLVFQREIESDATLNAVVGFAMTQPQGSDHEVIVSNKGYDLKFNTGPFDVSVLVRKTEGIVVREPKEKAPKTV